MAGRLFGSGRIGCGGSGGGRIACELEVGRREGRAGCLGALELQRRPQGVPS